MNFKFKILLYRIGRYMIRSNYTKSYCLNSIDNIVIHDLKLMAQEQRKEIASLKLKIIKLQIRQYINQI